jgi:predicted PurR-regulated permease PerM
MNEGNRHGIALARGFLLLLVIAATLAFLWLIAPFAGAIIWAVIAAVLFDPLNTRLLRAMPDRRGTAALATLAVIVGVVVVPAMLLGAALLREASTFYVRVQTGNIDLGRILSETQGKLPVWVRRWLSDIGVGDLEGIRAKLSEGFASSYQSLAAQLLDLGQGTFGFLLALGVMLYLSFFLLRDGRDLVAKIERALPLTLKQRSVLAAKFIAVTRATIKGSLVVAVVQGTVGGVIFWGLGIPGALLWGVTMGVFSLFPAVGTGLIWVPVTIYLFATGQIWQAIVLGASGLLVISSVDNVLRPILVGRDARMPDYVVLISTLGGFELMGFNGFVIGPILAALFIAVWEIFSDVPTSPGPAPQAKAGAPGLKTVPLPA